jgi:hypothetical protein
MTHPKNFPPGGLALPGWLARSRDWWRAAPATELNVPGRE